MQFNLTFIAQKALEALHYVFWEIIVRYGIHKKEESVPMLIEARKLMRDKGLSKWEAVDEVIKEMKENGRLNFFHGDFISRNDTCCNNYQFHQQRALNFCGNASKLNRRQNGKKALFCFIDVNWATECSTVKFNIYTGARF